LSGINVRATVYGVYAFSALTSSIAGILYTSRLAKVVAAVLIDRPAQQAAERLNLNAFGVWRLASTVTSHSKLHESHAGSEFEPPISRIAPIKGAD
jgi:hypothetical protein